jgi:aryl sulfotransferase
MNPNNQPQRTRTYQNHHLDSTRWDSLQTRADDIVITTAYKSGTTWMQTIVAQLVFQGQEMPAHVLQMSPWIDARWRPLEEVVSEVDNQQHRRFLKTHLALDGFPYRPELKFIYVGRDLRDIFMSLWNHYGTYDKTGYALFNDTPGRVGDPMPLRLEDIHDQWRLWAARGWFEWEKEGYPFWSSTHHAQTWWDFRHLPNILFVHFADLLAAPSIEIQRIADFLQIEVTEDSLAHIVEAVSFKSMKSNPFLVLGDTDGSFKGGAKRLINKGTNGRWRDVFDATDLEAYEALIATALSPECARWLEGGRENLVGAAAS